MAPGKRFGSEGYYDASPGFKTLQVGHVVKYGLVVALQIEVEPFPYFPREPVRFDVVHVEVS